MMHEHSFAEDDSPAAFALGLTDPRIAAPGNVVAYGGKGVAKRYNVYRNNVTVSLINALAAVYPVVQRITGPEFFRAMARFHIRSAPPVSPLLFEYGREFPAFIASYEYAREMPWLADTARVERAWLDAYHAADAEPLDAQALASLPGHELMDATFLAHPAARIVRSSYPAVAIFAANKTEGPALPVCSNEPEDALITRPAGEVIVTRLPAGGATFLTRLLAGRPLGVAATAAFDETPAFDLPANLAGMISAGVFTAIQEKE